MSFFGRETEISTLLDNSQKKNKFCIVSPTGVGKSEILDQANIVATQRGITCISHVIEPNASSVQDVVVNLLHQLLQEIDSQDLKLNDFVGYLQENASSIALSTLSALCSDGMRCLAPGLRKTAGVVFEKFQAAGISTDATIKGQKIIEDHNNITKTFTELLNLYDKQGGQLAIFIDRLESSSIEVVDFIRGLTLTLPSNFYLYMALNNEVTEGREFYQNNSAEFSFAEIEFLNLEPLETVELQKWYQITNSKDISLQDIADISAQCEGRTLYIKEWMEGRDVIEIKDSLSKKIGPSYSKRVNLLTSDAKELLYSLCILPEKIIYDVVLIRTLSQLNEIKLVTVLKELTESGILSNKANGYIFTHETVRRTILAQIPIEFIKPISIQILDKIESNEELAIDNYVQLRLNYQAEYFDNFHEQALLVASELHKKGNVGTSNEVYLMMKGTLSIENHEISNQIILGEINNDLLIGNYGNCLATVREMRVDEAPSTLNTRLDLLESKCYLRLNQYVRSFRVAARVPKSEVATIEDKVDALRTINTLYRDMGEYQNAEKVAEKIADWFEKGIINPALESKVYRTMARTYALSGKETESIENANEAVISAEKFQSARDLANAYLAQGESYRHAKKLVDSISAYNSAIDLARSTGNIDCLLWSTLGLSDAHILNDDLDNAEEVISTIFNLLDKRASKHPIEYLHWKLTKYSVDFIRSNTSTVSIEKVLSSYKKLKVKWPEDYINKLHANDNRVKTF